MKALCLVVLIFTAINVSVAALTASQAAARATGSKKLVEILKNAAKQDGQPGLSIREIEAVLGKSDSVKSSDRWKRAKQYIYKLSGGRWLEVTEGQGSIYEAILVDGKERWLVWK